MTKLEALAFYKFINVSEKFLKGVKTATTQEERKIASYMSKMKDEEEKNIKINNFRKEVIKAGYSITDKEINLYYDFKNNTLKFEIVKADKPKLLLAIYKAFPDMKVEGHFSNSEYYKGELTLLEDLRNNIHKLYIDKHYGSYKNIFKDSDIIYFAKPSNEWLMLFARGYFDWDNKKVLYLIKNGAKYITVVGSERSYEDTYPIFGEDTAITLLIKDYCEKHL